MHDGIYLGLGIEVQNEERLGVRFWCLMIAAGGQLEFGAGTGNLEENALVAIVVVEPAVARRRHEAPADRPDQRRPLADDRHRANSRRGHLADRDRLGFHRGRAQASG